MNIQNGESWKEHWAMGLADQSKSTWIVTSGSEFWNAESVSVVIQYMQYILGLSDPATL